MSLANLLNLDMKPKRRNYIELIPSEPAGTPGPSYGYIDEVNTNAGLPLRWQQPEVIFTHAEYPELFALLAEAEEEWQAGRCERWP